MAVTTDRSAVVHAEAPLGDVVVMGAPVGHLAAGVFVPPAELVMAAFLDVIDAASGRATCPSSAPSAATFGKGPADRLAPIRVSTV